MFRYVALVKSIPLHLDQVGCVYLRNVQLQHSAYASRTTAIVTSIYLLESAIGHKLVYRFTLFEFLLVLRKMLLDRLQKLATYGL